MNLQKFPSEGLSAGEPSLCHTGISLYCLCHCVLHIDDGSTFRLICQVRAARRRGWKPDSSAVCCSFPVHICELILKHRTHFLTPFSFYGIITLWQQIICILSFIPSIRIRNMQVISKQHPSKRRNFYGFSDTDHWETEKHRPDRP